MHPSPTRESPDRLEINHARRRMRWRLWRVGAMKRSRRLQAVARLSRSARLMSRRIWYAVPWLLLGGLLLAASLLAPASLSHQIGGIFRWIAVACAVAAPLAALLLYPPRRHDPSQQSTILVYLAIMAITAYVALRFIVPVANNFYSISLLTEGALLLYALHAVQSAMQRISPSSTTAAPRAADALIDGVRVLLIVFFLGSAILWRPVAALALVIALAFAALAILFRGPGAAASLVRATKS